MEPPVTRAPAPRAIRRRGDAYTRDGGLVAAVVRAAFTGRFSDDGKVITGTCEICHDGATRERELRSEPHEGRLAADGEASMGITFPGESAEYREARDELLAREVALRREMEAVAAARRALPAGGVVPEDYVFQGADPAPHDVRLSELFAPGRDSLV